jgi:hypothetical protein
MYKFNSYQSAIGLLESYWFQETADFEPALVARLPLLK